MTRLATAIAHTRAALRPGDRAVIETGPHRITIVAGAEDQPEAPDTLARSILTGLRSTSGAKRRQP